MCIFQVLNLDRLYVEEFDLVDHPLNVAASYAWIDKTSVAQKEAFNSSCGGEGIRAVLFYLGINHCWID